MDDLEYQSMLQWIKDNEQVWKQQVAERREEMFPARLRVDTSIKQRSATTRRR